MPELLHEAAIAEFESLEGDLLADLLAMYFDQAAGLMTELTSAVGRGHAPAVRRAAHNLKGSSRTLGATRVGDVASDLEAAALDGDLSVAGELLDSLRSGLHETENALRSRAALQ
jgi:HPt (histidine-containing phosphotransfer) domain-containing protein